MRQLYSLLILLLLLAGVARAQAPSCDADKSCVGNALTIEVTRGKGAQYVDVDTSAALRSLDTAMTFEAWIKPSPQPGKRQFVAGLWGPNRDNNDQWVVYIDDDRISFALSAPGSRLGDVDNTVASATVPNLYTRGWTHIAAAWDGVSTAARLYVDGIEVARTTNPSYPIQRLHRIERALPMQIGSCNILFDDTLNYRAFKGQIDEIRLWKRALTPLEIRCQHNQSLAGNEAGLVLYYRCNLPNTAQDLCDATRNNIVGRMRSGAHCDRSDRVVPATFLVTPATITRQLDCIGYDTLTFSIVDTSFCGSRVNLAIAGRDASTFRVSPSSLVLSQNIPATFQVFADAKTIGAISASVRIRNVNACGDPVNVPLNYNRKTDLSYSRTRILLDTLFVGCTERTFEEDTIQICNTTGSPRTISGIGPLDTSFTWRPESRPLPVTLAPNECWTVIVRMNATDTTRTNRDTLRVLSDDRCPGSGIIPLEGHTQDVLGILTPDARSVVRRLNFEAVCPGQLSDVRLYQYRNLVGEEIELDSIVATTDFVVRRIVFPLRLRPNFAYQPEFVRSRPSRPGPLTGEVRFYLRFRGCTIVRKIDLSGSGISVDVDFQNGGIFFGNVTIGKSRQLDDTARNNGNDPRRMSSYLKIGDVFRIVAGRTFNIAPGGRQPVAVEFRPREPITYYDTLCIFDEQCYADTCIPISGTGVFEALQFEPPYMALENAAGCKCLTDTITLRNIT